jgi:hypothetical protein
MMHDEGQAKNLRRLPFAGGRNEVCGRPLLLLDIIFVSYNFSRRVSIFEQSAARERAKGLTAVVYGLTKAIRYANIFSPAVISALNLGSYPAS